ncbi:uncharacterized protein LOC121421279 [Lytechinus variegatus]|uniref:uncharacterized protein LOC121421279 n=1 Tax=Lytechinus variegatus TaxID=7654 RepID=UPI001BB11907|nr:uncharacterized protein LOC121421279 [Lytechinus variegatus]
MGEEAVNLPLLSDGRTDLGTGVSDQAAPTKGGFTQAPPGFLGMEGANRPLSERQIRCWSALEWLMRGRLLPYPGVIVRMAPSELSWDLVLGFLDRAYARAVERADAGWVFCLHEYLRERLSLGEYKDRFALLDERGRDDKLLFFDPDTPWWEPAMAWERRFPRGLAYLPQFEGRSSAATAKAPWSQGLHAPVASTARCAPEQVGPSLKPAALLTAPNFEEEVMNSGKPSAASKFARPDRQESPFKDMRVPEAQAGGPSTRGTTPHEKKEVGRRGLAGAPATLGKRTFGGATGGPVNKRKVRGPCPLCQQRPHHKLKVHVYRHMPPALRLGQDKPAGDDFPLHEVMGCLQFLAKCFTGTHNLNSLIRFVNRSAPDNWNLHIPPAMEEEMFRLLDQLGASRPESITAQPINSIAALLHWRVLAWLVQQLTEEETVQLHQLGGSSTSGQGEAMPAEAAQPKLVGSTIPQRR